MTIGVDMKRYNRLLIVLGLGLLCPCPVPADEVVFEVTSAYHHIQVVDKGRFRVLHFDNATESRISLDDPLQGHFEYTEYFHMPWLWNDRIKTVLMLGLGGGSIQRSYQHYYPQVQCQTVELDPKVVEVAKDYFQVKESEALKIAVEDGRVFLRRVQEKYDVILLDAYTANRYGSFIPYSLATKEFFSLTKEHLTENGVLAYNVIGDIDSRRENIVGSIYQTLKTAFPQVYAFPAISSRNVVLVATRSEQALDLAQLKKRADALESKQATFPNLKTRLEVLRTDPPRGADRSRILTDDFAPVDGMLQAE
jgi:spermidine synthase